MFKLSTTLRQPLTGNSKTVKSVTKRTAVKKCCSATAVIVVSSSVKYDKWRHLNKYRISYVLSRPAPRYDPKGAMVLFYMPFWHWR